MPVAFFLSLIGWPASGQPCLDCHGNVLPQLKKSVHASSACTDCHRVHAIPMPAPPDAAVRKRRLLAACARCHKGIWKQYSRSVHAAAGRGVKGAPTCSGCHGEHLVRPHLDPQSKTYRTNLARTCSRCHENLAIQRRLGLPPERLASYMDSLHGIAAQAGDASAPNCATCHNSHNILPSSDPGSSVNKKNLPRTCGKCHHGANVNFARGSVHVRPAPNRDIGVFLVQTFYRCFITTLVSAFLIYIALDLAAHWRARRRSPSPGRQGAQGGKEGT